MGFMYYFNIQISNYCFGEECSGPRSDGIKHEIEGIK